ncbi:MAG: hypothetical protein U5P10_16365 [Spirochaetia bacterium]|nr:hypothetical protein [Spirochaetia bacterium]
MAKTKMESIIYLRKLLTNIDTIMIQKKMLLIKYFLEEIYNTCNLIATSFPNTKLYNDSIKVSHIVKRFLYNPMFNHLPKLSLLPEYSTVLLSKAGYREMLLHYLNSKKGHFSIFKKIEKYHQKSGLKKVSTIFELWSFFKVANMLFDEGINISCI